MRDHIHPPRVSSPSCIVPPTKDMIVRPYMLPLLPTFHGMESENPYSHIRDFEEVYNTFKEDATSLDLMRLKFFPLTLKDKVKIWLNSLRPRTIWNWTEMQAEFLKKKFLHTEPTVRRGKSILSQPMKMKNSTNARKDTWKPSVHVLTMVLTPGC